MTNNRSYRWSITDLREEDIFRHLLRFGFLICMVIGTMLSSYFNNICIGLEDKVVLKFGDIVLVGRVVFSS
jgi:hypothetical protein